MNSTAVIIALALGIPALAAAAARTAPIRRAAPNTAGIALQTVIVIVVMLLIAGGVSAVLLSRGQEAIGDLESASVGVVTPATCSLIKVGTITGMDGTTTCTWTETGAVGDATQFTEAQCTTVGGIADANLKDVTKANGKCVVTY